MDNNLLKQYLTEEYEEDPYAYGSYALRRVLSYVDLKTFSKENLDTVFAFIDAPKNIGEFIPSDCLKNKTLASLYCTHNLKTLGTGLPELVELDPIREQENSRKVTEFADVLNESRVQKLQTDWDKADTSEKRNILQKTIEIFNENNTSPIKVKFIKRFKGRGYFDSDKNQIYIKINDTICKIFGFSGCMATFIHESAHAEIWNLRPVKPLVELYFTYYILPYEGGVQAYKGNYLEKDAYDREYKFLALFDNEKQKSGR